MLDANNREIHVQDKVAYIDGFSGSAIYLSTGYVLKLTPKRVSVGDSIDAKDGSSIKATRLVVIN